ncbi:MAG: hypothetical protein WA781_00100 [Pseudolabrys sp.]
MGPNTHPRYGRAGGIARHLFLVLAMIAAQLPLAQIAAAQQPATREGAQVPAPNKMHRIAIVLAREQVHMRGGICPICVNSLTEPVRVATCRQHS